MTSNQDRMDAQAKLAKAELTAPLGEITARELAQWWVKNLGAGHKRLGRILINKLNEEGGSK